MRFGIPPLLWPSGAAKRWNAQEARHEIEARKKAYPQMSQMYADEQEMKK
jgi:hypothetical protein